jgi:hypothetical protein
MTPATLRRSYVEATPRERIVALADPGTFREILDPFARCSSPYLAEQGVVAQRDDGVVIGRALLEGRDVAAIAVDGRFLGGSIGEIGGAKIARVLERARDGAFLLLDTGGIRLQEANLGLLAIAEICDAIVALRERAPGRGRHCRARRVLRWNEHRGRALLADRHESGRALRPQRARGHRTRSRHRRTRRARPSGDLAGDGRPAPRRTRTRGHLVEDDLDDIAPHASRGVPRSPEPRASLARASKRSLRARAPA